MTRNIENPYEIDGIEFKAIGNRIQQALEIRGMRQSELSGKTGIAKSSISEYIAGKNDPKQKKLLKIANALDVNVEWLLGTCDRMDRISTIIDFTDREKEMVESYRRLDEHSKELISFILKQGSHKSNEALHEQ